MSEKLRLTGGFRRERAKYSFDYEDLTGPSPPIDSKNKPYENAYSIGSTYSYADSSNLFFNFNRSFRFPATDEYFTWGTLNTDLKPQASQNYEAGINHQFTPQLNTKVSLFLMNLKNEIYYNPLSFATENYDKTRRKGFEAFLSYEISQNIGIKGGYSYIKSTFRDGDYKGKNVPMVPRNKINAGIGFKTFDRIKLNVNGSFVDSSYVMNDQSNDLKRLGSYFTLDSNVSYSYNDLFIMFGVNNILGKQYSEHAAYSTMSNDTGYYPSPTRNFVTKVSYKF